jgi:hypothetical protein
MLIDVALFDQTDRPKSLKRMISKKLLPHVIFEIVDGKWSWSACIQFGTGKVICGAKRSFLGRERKRGVIEDSLKPGRLSVKESSPQESTSLFVNLGRYSSHH